MRFGKNDNQKYICCLNVWDFVIPLGMAEKEREATKKLKDLVHTQKDEIRAKEHELALKQEDIEAVGIKITHITNVGI